MSTVRSNSVDDIKVYMRRGPWATKSGGELSVLFGMPADELDAFLDRGNPEFAAVKAQTGVDISGLRSYEVTGIAAGNVGAMEWHKARTEYVRAVEGKALWLCMDSTGKTAEFILDATTAVMTPSGILHAYKALEPTRLQVICNTIFDPDDPRTHDSYSAEMFGEQAAAFAAKVRER